jgi:hypothetical protein
VLQFPLPKSHPRTVAATGIGGDQESFGFRIAWASHPPPPPADAFHGKGRRIMIHSHTHPADIPPQIVDPVGSHLALFWFANLEVVNPNLLRLALELPLTSSILEIPHQLFLLGVYRDHRFALLQIPLSFAVDVVKLFISIRVLAALQRLLVGLQTVIQIVKQFGHGLIADTVALLPKFFGQAAHALARPTQRGFRVSAGHRVQKPIEILQ